MKKLTTTLMIIFLLTLLGVADSVQASSIPNSSTLAIGNELETGGMGGVTIPQKVHSGIPTISIVEVERDETVTIRTHNYPANLDFVVRMDVRGNRALGGIFVTTINSGDGGSFTATFEIPDALKSVPQIAIRLDSTVGGFFSYNWFYNTTAEVTPPIDHVGIPTISIIEVERDETVTIRTHNYPANLDFEVRMDVRGNRALGGIFVTTINSGDGGSFTATFEIPDSLKSVPQIAIRLDSTVGGFFSYNWFHNTTYP